MSRVSLAVAAIAGLALLPGSARSEDEPRDQPIAAPLKGDARARLVQQVSDERATLDRTAATVVEKLAVLDTERARRLAAAYRVLRAPTGRDPLAAARRRAAARWVVASDLGERQLLADELAELRAATTQVAAAAAQAPILELPTRLAPVVRGSIARRFGTLVHERSKATLARRGLDFDVEPRAPVSAPAAGTVRFAGPIRGLDNGLVIDHGTYYSVLGKLGELAVPAGATVAAGDRLGRAQRHRVYLEIRVKLGPGGLPIDPEPLLAAPR